jgi:hypothetical protein
LNPLWYSSSSFSKPNIIVKDCCVLFNSKHLYPSFHLTRVTFDSNNWFDTVPSRKLPKVNTLYISVNTQYSIFIIAALSIEKTLSCPSNHGLCIFDLRRFPFFALQEHLIESLSVAKHILCLIWIVI